MVAAQLLPSSDMTFMSPHCTLAAEAGPVCAHVHQAAERGQGEADLHLQLQLWLLSRDRDCRGRRKVKVIDLIPLILYLLMYIVLFQIIMKIV